MSSTVLSLVVCTHNRVKYLVRVLDSLYSQCEDLGGLEIIVVDNASTDATAEGAPTMQSTRHPASSGMSTSR